MCLCSGEASVQVSDVKFGNIDLRILLFLVIYEFLDARVFLSYGLGVGIRYVMNLCLLG